MLLAATGLTGCYWWQDNMENPMVEYGYFMVQLRHDDGYAVIRRFSDLGRQQEILIVPTEVKGLPVRQIGRSDGILQGPGDGRPFASENLRKIYVPHGIATADTFLGLSPVEEFVRMGVNMSIWTIPSLFFSNDFHTSIIHPHFTHELVPNIIPPNLFFMYNYYDAPNQGYYWFDYINDNNLHLMPPSPARQNYTFTGWYLEPQGLTRWNNQMPTFASEILKLYATWQAI